MDLLSFLKGGKERKTCGLCKFWEKEKDFQWGICTAPLPFWVKNKSGILSYETIKAEKCQTFKRKN